LWFVLAIPFVPQFISNTDNQPTFTILALFFFILSYKKFSKKALLFSLFSFLAFTIAFIFSILIKNSDFQTSRFLSFFQFIIAINLGASSAFTIPKNWFKYSIYVYVIFTLIYFLTGGIIENTLILSREITTQELLLSGRGARTLSPEPAIMSIQILNIFVLWTLFYSSIKPNFKSYLGLFFLLIGSLSGYGFVIAIVILLIYNPLIIISIFLLFILIFYQCTLNIDFQSTRIGNILNNLGENGTQFFVIDQSFLSRLDSFNDYNLSFIKTFPYGDAFTIMNGGGFISIISALGLLGMFLFLYLLITIIISNYKFNFKVLFIFWFFLYFFTGSFGLPIIGVILGKHLQSFLKYE
jgi:hypothetical protein